MGSTIILFTVDAFTDVNGVTPTFEALHAFEVKSAQLRSMTEAGMGMLQSSANHTGNLVERVGPELWRLKIRHGNRWATLFFTFARDFRIILLNGYVSAKEELIIKHLGEAEAILANFKMMEMKVA